MEFTELETETLILASKCDFDYTVYTCDDALKKMLGAFAKKYPDLCVLMEETKEGGALYIVDRAWFSFRLTEPFS